MAEIYSFAGITPRIDPTAFIAPTAVLIGNVEVGPNASVWFGAVLRGDNPDQVIRVGARTSIQDNCVLHISERGPTIVGEDATIGHGAIFESCTIGRGALVGLTSVILHEAEIGDYAVVGALSLVLERTKVPPRTLIAGSPASVRKELTDEAVEMLRASANHYVELASRYRTEGITGW